MVTAVVEALALVDAINDVLASTLAVEVAATEAALAVEVVLARPAALLAAVVDVNEVTVVD